VTATESIRQRRSCRSPVCDTCAISRHRQAGQTDRSRALSHAKRRSKAPSRPVQPRPASGRRRAFSLRPAPPSAETRSRGEQGLLCSCVADAAESLPLLLSAHSESGRASCKMPVPPSMQGLPVERRVGGCCCLTPKRYVGAATALRGGGLIETALWAIKRKQRRRAAPILRLERAWATRHARSLLLMGLRMPRAAGAGSESGVSRRRWRGASRRCEGLRTAPVLSACWSFLGQPSRRRGVRLE
jgi:hypothetical protein